MFYSELLKLKKESVVRAQYNYLFFNGGVVMDTKDFKFPFGQQTSFDKPVCSMCHMTCLTGEPRTIRAGHVVHTRCAIEFDIVEDARRDLSAVFARMPKQFFEGSTIVERLSRVFTKDGLRTLLICLADMIGEKKDMLRKAMASKFDEIIAALTAAANHVRLGHKIASALA